MAEDEEDEGDNHEDVDVAREDVDVGRAVVDVREAADVQLQDYEGPSWGQCLGVIGSLPTAQHEHLSMIGTS